MEMEYFKNRIYATFKASLISADMGLGAETTKIWATRCDEACRISRELAYLTRSDIEDIKLDVIRELQEGANNGKG